jgi:signal transduction histidine kinase/ActR/RegA family two-component response regulator
MLWVWLVADLRGRTLEAAQADMRRVSAVVAEQVTRLLETQALILDLTDREAGARSCAALRDDERMQRFLMNAVRRGSQTEVAWVLDAAGYQCVGSDPTRLDDDSRAYREYFSNARDAAPGRFTVDRGVIGLPSGTPAFTVARRRGEDPAFTGVVVAAVGLRDLVAHWRELLAALPTHRVAVFRAEGVLIARSFEPLVAPPNPAAEAAIAQLWRAQPEGARLVMSLVDGMERVSAWRSIPGWGVVVTSSVAKTEALRPWWRFALLSAAVAAIASTLLAVVMAWFARAGRHLERTNAELERRVEARTAELRDSEARLRAIFDAVPVGIAFAEASSGRLVFGNAGMARALRLPASGQEEARRPLAWEALGEDGVRVDPAALPLERALGSGEPAQGEYYLACGDGTRRWIAIGAVPLRDGAGAVTGAVVVCTDVDDARRARAVLARDHAELETLVAARSSELAETQARLAHAQRMEALGQLAGGIAHDFNNVMQAVAGGAALIRRRSGDPHTVDHLARMVEEAAARGASVTRRLLAFARRGELRAEAVAPGQLLAEVQEVLGHTLGPGIEVRVDAPPGLPPLLADRGQLETVLVNLATNARDAMPGGGSLIFAAAHDMVDAARPHDVALRPGHYIRLSVSDTGEGMAPEVLRRAAEPFFTTKPTGKGTGLGLAMARGFAEQSDGALAIRSTPGTGTTVTLWLPLAHAMARAGAAPPAGLAQASLRLLVVDDEDLVREVVAQGLEAGGYEVLRARDAQTALALLAAGAPVDLLLTDLAMPGTDGLTLLREARRLRPGLPALLLTGNAGDLADEAAVALDGLAGGPFSLLRKPVRAEELALHVARMGRRATRSDGAAFPEPSH